MDPRQEILNQQRRRHQNLLRQVERDKRQTRSTYYAGQDANGQPLVRATGGAAVPMRSLSNLQPEIGQQGRSDGRGFDVGVRRSFVRKDRRHDRPLDIIYVYDTPTETKIFSKNLGEKSFSVGNYFFASIYRPNDLATESEIKLLLLRYNLPTATIDMLNIENGLYSTSLSITNNSFYSDGTNGIDFVSRGVIQLSVSNNDNSGDVNTLCLAYAPFWEPPLLFLYDSGDSSGNSLQVSGTGIAASGIGDWHFTSSSGSDHYYFKRLVFYDGENYGAKQIVPPFYRLSGAINNINFDYPVDTASPSLGLFLTGIGEMKVSYSGDLNLIQVKGDPNQQAIAKDIEISRIYLDNGILRAGQFKKIPIPAIAKINLRAIDVPRSILIDTGRGLNP